MNAIPTAPYAATPPRPRTPPPLPAQERRRLRSHGRTYSLVKYCGLQVDLSFAAVSEVCYLLKAPAQPAW